MINRKVVLGFVWVALVAASFGPVEGRADEQPRLPLRPELSGP